MRDERLLVVDDVPEIGRFVLRVAEEMGYAVNVVGNAKDFRERYSTFQPTAIVLDLVMPEEDGIELLNFLRHEGSTARIVVISGSDSHNRKLAEKLGLAYGLRIVANLGKPFGLKALRTALDRAATSQPSDRG